MTHVLLWFLGHQGKIENFCNLSKLFPTVRVGFFSYFFSITKTFVLKSKTNSMIFNCQIKQPVFIILMTYNFDNDLAKGQLKNRHSLIREMTHLEILIHHS
jgi:hypothetical protein